MLIRRYQNYYMLNIIAFVCYVFVFKTTVN
jgi:hypothetical protein